MLLSVGIGMFFLCYLCVLMSLSSLCSDIIDGVLLGLYVFL